MTTTKHGLLRPEIMDLFPSRTGVPMFADWVANHAGLEQVLGVAGMLSPSFHEVEGAILWNQSVAAALSERGFATPFGNDRRTVEKYCNLLNLSEFFLLAADEACESDALLDAFGRVLEHFWRLALEARFPGRSFGFERSESPYDEDGPCLTFWQADD